MKLFGNVAALACAVTVVTALEAQAKFIKLDFDLSVANGDPWDYARYVEAEEHLRIGGFYFGDPFLLTASGLNFESDGYVERAPIDASRGYNFDALQFDFSFVRDTAVRVFRCGDRPPVTIDYGGGVTEVVDCSDGNFDYVAEALQQDGLTYADLEYNSDYFEVIGYRGSKEVARAILDPKAGDVIRLGDFGNFTNLTSLDIGLDYVTYGGDFTAETGTYYFCENGCGRVTIDNLFLDVTERTTPVPLPAGILLLPAALGGLVLLRRRKR